MHAAETAATETLLTRLSRASATIVAKAATDAAITMQRRLAECSGRRRVSMGALGGDAVLAGLVVKTALSVRGSVSTLVVAALVAHVGGIVGVLVVGMAAVGVVVGLLGVRLRLCARGVLGLAGRLAGSRGAADLRVGGGAPTEARLAMLGAALGVLAEVIALGRVITAKRTLGLRGQGILLALRTLLLTETLVVVVEAVLGIRRIVRRVVVGGGAEGTARLLLGRRLRGLSLALEATLELVLRGRGNSGLLAEWLKRLRGGERRRLLGRRLAETAKLLVALRGRRLDGSWSNKLLANSQQVVR